ncbi:YAP1 (YML007W) and CAD1 (YDR423C) [Zygosaccharomyces parabailii]|nr:YAP1 (YML007W) and CAD1 (YDR423C) [Zygosaccharomyces parabailii]CDH11954.1 uncharacterized protein ZBAI_03740 [Zygosaccharomyces bailii ISA1307]
MSATSAKRPLEPTVSLEFANDEADKSPTSEEPRKKGGKPGRKPLDSEAKNKRTAQNRAAQRAFRERKERKMKELEEKVHALEEMNQQSLVETEFLRSQLVTLVNELKKYRPQNQADSQVLEYLAKTENDNDGASQQTRQELNSKELQESVRRKMSFTFAFPWKNEIKSEDKAGSPTTTEQPRNDNLQFPSPGSSSKSSSVSTSSSLSKKKIGLYTPGTADSNVNNNNLSSSTSNMNNGSFTPGSSSTGWMDNVFYNDDAQQLPQFYQSGTDNSSTTDNKLVEDNTSVPYGYDSVTFSNQFNFDDQFDEQVSEFCAKLGQVCGTKDCPVPRQKTASSTPNIINSPLVLSNTWDSPSRHQEEKVVTAQPAPAASDKTAAAKGNDAGTRKSGELPFIDTSLAFPEQDLFRESQPDNLFAEFIEDEPEKDNDPFLAANLINEEPQGLQPHNIQGPQINEQDLTQTQQQQEQRQQQGAKQHQATDVAECDGVVPSRDGKLLKCSEVWDRITSHPKYTDMDIDGLCLELMAKAKCSEKGVVVQAEDVQRALANRLD